MTRSWSCQKRQSPVQHQTDSYASIDNPVSGTRYEWRTGTAGNGADLGTQQNIRIISIAANVTWTIQPTPLEVHITIDGITWTWSFTNPVSAAAYYGAFNLVTWGSMNMVLVAADPHASREFLLEGRSIKLEVETTGGTVSNLKLHVKWAKYLP